MDGLKNGSTSSEAVAIAIAHLEVCHVVIYCHTHLT